MHVVSFSRICDCNIDNINRACKNLSLGPPFRQAALHGSCTIDMSCFGPDTELSRSIPRAVSSWGHCHRR